ncbi:Uncharacterised protein [uncultured archaeon]|nr:Uncharacterised protein [uncultured archaeon]
MEFAVFGRHIKIGWAHVGIVVLAAFLMDAVGIVAAHLITLNWMAQDGLSGQDIYTDMMTRTAISFAVITTPLFYVATFLLARQWKKWSEKDIESLAVLNGLAVLCFTAIYTIANVLAQRFDAAVMFSGIINSAVAAAIAYTWFNLILNWNKIKKSAGFWMQIAAIIIAPILITGLIVALGADCIDFENCAIARVGAIEATSQIILAELMLIAPLVAYYWTRKDLLWFCVAIAPTVIAVLKWLIFGSKLFAPPALLATICLIALGVWTMKEQGKLKLDTKKIFA